MMSNLSGWHAVILLIYPALIALGAWLLYFVVRIAVRHALRDHANRPNAGGNSTP